MLRALANTAPAVAIACTLDRPCVGETELATDSSALHFWRHSVIPPYIYLLLLAISIPSAAWGQQTACKPDDPWSEFHMQNMRRFNPCEHVLSVNKVGGLTVKWKFPLGT